MRESECTECHVVVVVVVDAAFHVVVMYAVVVAHENDDRKRFPEVKAVSPRMLRDAAKMLQRKSETNSVLRAYTTFRFIKKTKSNNDACV